MAKDVRALSAVVKAMHKPLPLIRALLGGTAAMRAAGKDYLPQWPNEQSESYAARLAVATLFPAYNRTVEVLAGKPFSKPLTLSDDVPARLKAWCEDIDLQGRNLHTFAATLCEEALGPGFCGILIDYPTTKGLRTQADEQQAGVRPYFVHIRLDDMLGWRCKRVNGVWTLTQFRFLETAVEEDGDFGEKAIEQVRVLYPGRWEIHRKVDGKDDWTLHDEGTTTLKMIPLVPVYGKRKAFMIGVPPLLDLAFMNVEHWQSKSDQQTILHVARVPILFTKMLGDEVEITVGANTAVKAQSPEADMKFVEHKGDAIEAGRKSLLDLEDQMRQAGAELLVIKPGNVTEAQTVADNEQGSCALQRIAGDLEDAIDAALQLMADWVGEKEGGHVTVYKDFGAATLAEASADLLQKMNVAGTLSDETLFEEFQRRGMIRPDLRWGDEQQRIGKPRPGAAPEAA
ncbi:DUF4055 domain-containing protein [Cupriavidus nantongensis]|uniref:DNA-binding protein n=1 Tax=Cupriavidus nantongensis TaxID=1796606 RepID=A0A142JHV9_9BURK|nr:DUF4055 domain-containing protein [Cupriavidus nantongensis]AMR77671.1 DNA-binding protein [Cupriavidus nantongensis]